MQRYGILRGAGLALFAILAAAPARPAATLDIAPVLIDVAAPGATGTVSVKNDQARPISIQVRLFKWRQAEGEESYQPTEAVVASPPIATIEPGASLTIRVIRAAETPATTEESYRLVLDQLPEADRNGRAKVAMLLRQVLPVFFGPADRSPPAVSWSVARTAKGWSLRARNAGDQRLRVAEVTLNGPGKAPVKLGGGLLGYVLGHSDMSWTIAHAAFRPGETVTVRGESDHGAFRATAPVAASR
jgi:fimbrial chaperone protein